MFSFTGCAYPQTVQQTRSRSVTTISTSFVLTKATPAKRPRSAVAQAFEKLTADREEQVRRAKEADASIFLDKDGPAVIPPQVLQAQPGTYATITMPKGTDTVQQHFTLSSENNNTATSP